MRQTDHNIFNQQIYYRHLRDGILVPVLDRTYCINSWRHHSSSQSRQSRVFIFCKLLVLAFYFRSTLATTAVVSELSFLLKQIILTTEDT